MVAAAAALCLVFSCGCSADAVHSSVPEPAENDARANIQSSVPEPASTFVPDPSPAPDICILGNSYKYDSESIDLSGIAPEEVLAAADDISRLKNLHEIYLLNEDGNTTDLDSLIRLHERFPDVLIHCSFELFGKTVSSEDEEILFERVNIGNAGVEILRSAMPLLHSCSKLTVSNCGIDNEVMAQLRDDYPDIKIVWKVIVHGYGHMTDIERIRTNLIDNADADLLKYFTDVKYIDVGHRKKLTNWEFLKYMPHLQVLIVSITDFSDKDLWYLTGCHELEYLEMASCHVTDLSPLAQCTSLEHLCIGNLPGVTDISPLYGLTKLKRLRISQDNVPQEQKDEITLLLPDCQMLFGPNHWGFAGNWRYEDNGEYVERYALLREQFEYDEYPWAGWDW